MFILKVLTSTIFFILGSVGPISVGLNAELLQYYSSGIFDEPTCSKHIDHTVLAVGYGSENVEYWIIKNSWGNTWGEDGYFRLVRNKDNQCGIANDSAFPRLR